MIFTRKIRYQFDDYKRVIKNLFNYSRLPSWLTGRISRCFMSVVLVVCSVCYVMQIACATSSGYEMRDLQRQVNSLNEEINKINIEAVSYGSLLNLKKRIQESNMARVSNIVYVTAPDVMFAKK